MHLPFDSPCAKLLLQRSSNRNCIPLEQSRAENFISFCFCSSQQRPIQCVGEIHSLCGYECQSISLARIVYQSLNLFCNDTLMANREYKVVVSAWSQNVFSKLHRVDKPRRQWWRSDRNGKPEKEWTQCTLRPVMLSESQHMMLLVPSLGGSIFKHSALLEQPHENRLTLALHFAVGSEWG